MLERCRNAFVVAVAMVIVALSATARILERGSRHALTAARHLLPYLNDAPVVAVRWVRPSLGPARADARKVAVLLFRASAASLRHARGFAGMALRLTARTTARPIVRHRRRVVLGSLAAVNAVMVVALGTPIAVDVAASTVDVPSPAFAPLASQTEVVAVDGSPLGVLPDGVRREVVDLDEIPPMVRGLVLAAEDRRFYDHEGFDGRAIVRAATSNAAARDITQGASTITQQLAKRNITGDDRTPARKVSEIIHARALEDSLTKGDLLERYLNEVYFGAGAYGIAAAARTYFGRSVAELEPHHAALLAAVIRAPSVLSPWRNAEEVRVRRDAVLRLAAEDGTLRAGAARSAMARPLDVVERPTHPPVLDAQTLALVERDLATLDVAGHDPRTRAARARRAGWRIETTLDPRVAQAASAALAARLGTQVAGSVAMVEPDTGRIVAVANHQPGAATPFPLASEGKRQPGSAFKPFAAIAALENGLRLDQRFEGRGPRRFDLGRENWVVDNFEGADYDGISLADALEHSVNTAFAQLAVAVGADEIADTAHSLGISSEAIGAPSERGPAIALGGLRRGVSPLELAESYAAIATDGSHAPATVVERIRDRDGKVLYERRPGGGQAGAEQAGAEQATSPAATSTVRAMLERVVTDGTGKAAALEGRPAFGKTGTSQDRADAWFAGAVPQLAAVVWVGDPDRREPMPAATGGTTAAPIWHDVMTAALAGAPPVAFAAPIEPSGNRGIPLPDAFPCDRRCASSDTDP